MTIATLRNQNERLSKLESQAYQLRQSTLRFLMFACMSIIVGVVWQNAATADDDVPAVTVGSNDNERETTGVADPWLDFVNGFQPKLVKIYGAGGLKGLESYQSGFVVSQDGLIATSWSTVLDVNSIRVTTHDGQKAEAEMVGMDPQTEIAVLKMNQPTSQFFSLENAQPPIAGIRVFGLSNLFGIATGDEAVSIQRGVVMAVAPLSAKRGRLKTLYQGRVLVLDVMTNNPGATGGAVVDLDGNLVGMLGKELRDEQTNIWLNYALPIDVVAGSVKRIIEGKTDSSSKRNAKSFAERPHKLSSLGIVLIPDVLPKTPPFIDQVTMKSIAERSGLRSNDLILLLNEERVDSRRTLEEALARIDRADSFSILVERGQELVRIDIRP